MARPLRNVCSDISELILKLFMMNLRLNVRCYCSWRLCCLRLRRSRPFTRLDYGGSSKIGLSAAYLSNKRRALAATPPKEIRPSFHRRLRHGQPANYDLDL